ncbi:hypothetical protein DACRYDRAFT_22938 [Dacryopinax primogenitus]|uniref:Uncharacterized protein n=1 Tax=Dacryopinax primogenitus (strain DJM 731) TaxID=1858805 RepID=M5FXJ5_DACPD|nr:uncharacterized protein DACRYDRAFT_22938 [Dacryopinax primogenitus]EJU01189.1 hypothetical protein DACRYDRAFT_22938 [Dacryopinax primogenitus]
MSSRTSSPIILSNPSIHTPSQPSSPNVWSAVCNVYGSLDVTSSAKIGFGVKQVLSGASVIYSDGGKGRDGGGNVSSCTQGDAGTGDGEWPILDNGETDSGSTESTITPVGRAAQRTCRVP